MGTQRAFLSPASSSANNGLHKYEQHINTGPGWSSGQQTPDLTLHSVKLSWCKSSQSECSEGVAGMREGLQMPVKTGD